MHIITANYSSTATVRSSQLRYIFMQLYIMEVILFIFFIYFLIFIILL